MKFILVLIVSSLACVVSYNIGKVVSYNIGKTAGTHDSTLRTQTSCVLALQMQEESFCANPPTSCKWKGQSK